MFNKWYRPVIVSLALLSVAPAYGMEWFSDFAKSKQMREFLVENIGEEARNAAEGVGDAFNNYQEGVRRRHEENMEELCRRANDMSASKRERDIATAELLREYQRKAKSEEFFEEVDTEVDNTVTSDSDIASNVYMRELFESMGDAVKNAAKDVGDAYNNCIIKIKLKHEENMEEFRSKAKDMSTSEDDREAAAAELLSEMQNYAKFQSSLDELRMNLFQHGLSLFRSVMQTLIGELADKAAQNEEAQERIEELKKTAANTKLPKWLRDAAQGELIQEVLSNNEENEEVQKLVLLAKELEKLTNTIQLPKWLQDAGRDSSVKDTELNSNNE